MNKFKVLVFASTVMGCSQLNPQMPNHIQNKPQRITEQSTFSGLLEERIETSNSLYFECKYQSGVLSYSTYKGLKSIELDQKIDSPDYTLCSEKFTVLISGKNVVVAIGEEKIRSDVNFLGYLDGNLQFANSYLIVLTDKIFSEGIVRFSLKSNIFSIQTSESLWSVNLLEANEWDIKTIAKKY